MYRQMSSYGWSVCNGKANRIPIIAECASPIDWLECYRILVLIFDAGKGQAALPTLDHAKLVCTKRTILALGVEYKLRRSNTHRFTVKIIWHNGPYWLRPSLNWSGTCTTIMSRPIAPVSCSRETSAPCPQAVSHGLRPFWEKCSPCQISIPWFTQLLGFHE